MRDAAALAVATLLAATLFFQALTAFWVGRVEVRQAALEVQVSRLEARLTLQRLRCRQHGDILRDLIAFHRAKAAGFATAPTFEAMAQKLPQQEVSE